MDRSSSNPAVAWIDLTAVARLTTNVTANRPGEQTVRLQFHEPMRVRRVRLVFSGTEQSRSQEFTVSASLHRGEQHKEVVRRQFNFSPRGATQEIEEYATDLEEVSALEVRIVPSIDGTPSIVQLTDFRVAAEPSSRVS